MRKFTEEDRIKAQAKANETRRRTKEAIDAKGIATCERLGEVRSIQDSVRSKCADCVSYNADGRASRLIRECDFWNCHLWPWRNGKLDLDGIDAETPEMLVREYKPWRK